MNKLVPSESILGPEPSAQGFATNNKLVAGLGRCPNAVMCLEDETLVGSGAQGQGVDVTVEVMLVAAIAVGRLKDVAE